MQITKLLTIVILLVTITILILSFKTQNNITNNKKIDIPRIVIPKVTIPKTDAYKKEDELSKIVFSLESIIEEDKNSIKGNKPTEDEVQDILSNLKALKPIEEQKKSIKKECPKRRVVKRKKLKRVVKRKKRQIAKHTKPKKIIVHKEIIIEKPPIKKKSITAEEYRARLAKESRVDKDIASLSMVNTVDIDIEKKIKEGKERELTTPKPLIEQTTIYIPPSNRQEIDDDIPWAELKEVNEKVNGIFIKEPIN